MLAEFPAGDWDRSTILLTCNQRLTNFESNMLLHAASYIRAFAKNMKLK